MKKIFALILATALILGCTFSLSACDSDKDKENENTVAVNTPRSDKPELDLAKAEENLEDEEYDVSCDYDEDELPINISQRLYASNEDDFLYIVVYKDSKSATLIYDNMILEYDMEIKTYEFEIDYCKNLLKNYEDDLDEDEIDEYEDEIDDFEEKLEEYKSEYVVGKNGKTLWYGTKQAVKDSKG